MIEVSGRVTHLLVGYDGNDDEQVADETSQTDCTEHQRQQHDRLETHNNRYHQYQTPLTSIYCEFIMQHAEPEPAYSKLKVCNSLQCAVVNSLAIIRHVDI